MTVTGPRTAEDLKCPKVRQFSVFLPNQIGALLELTRLLAEGGVHICGLSVVDTADAAVVRIVVDDPEHCREVLRRADIPLNESVLVVVELPQGPEQLVAVFRSLVAAEVNIQYTYPLLVRPRNNPLLALHCEDADFADEVLREAGFTVLRQKDISR